MAELVVQTLVKIWYKSLITDGTTCICDCALWNIHEHFDRELSNKLCFFFNLKLTQNFIAYTILC